MKHVNVRLVDFHTGVDAVCMKFTYISSPDTSANSCLKQEQVIKQSKRIAYEGN